MNPTTNNEAILTFETEDLEVRTGTNERGPWEIREQTAIIETRQLRMPIKVSLGKGKPPHKPGRYVLDLVRSLSVSNFGGLQLRTQHLTPAK